VLKVKRRKLPRINCRITPEPQEGTRPIYKKNGSKIEPFIVGTGDIDYICGRCDNIIAQNVSQSQIASDAVFQCPNCQAFNEVE
jgi:DNA-directed RNA polymerase subunit RPC12/RpoP